MQHIFQVTLISVSVRDFTSPQATAPADAAEQRQWLALYSQQRAETSGTPAIPRNVDLITTGSHFPRTMLSEE